MQNCEGVLQSLKKSTEGVFQGRRLSSMQNFKSNLAGIGGGTECVPEGYRPGGQAPESP